MCPGHRLSFAGPRRGRRAARMYPSANPTLCRRFKSTEPAVSRRTSVDLGVIRGNVKGSQKVIHAVVRRIAADFGDKNTRLVVQGITGRDGSFHTTSMMDYRTNVVAGVTPGKGGQKMDEVPIFNSVKEAREKTGCNASMILVPPPFAADAIMEAADAGIEKKNI